MRAWENFVAAQESELGCDTVLKWLKSLKILRFDACNLYLEARDAFQAIWFEEHIREKVQGKLLNGNKKHIKVHLTVANVPTKSKVPSPKGKRLEEETRSNFTLSFDDVDPQLNFGNYVVSEPNEFTYKVFCQIAGLEGGGSRETILNPLYVHGGVGSGKTHLLMSLAHALRQQGLHVIYARADSFTDHVVSAIRAGEMSVFRQAYRNSDVLIIDDVHVFSRKAATQEEFFHTFNTLHTAGKQIILSAKCPPAELQLIEPRLVSRFEWGIVLSLEAASPQDAAKILAAKAAGAQFPLHGKVSEFLLESFGNMKSLNRALDALILRSHLNKGSAKGQAHLTVPSVKQLLHDLIVEEENSALTATKVLRRVAEFFGIRPEDVTGKSQTRDCVLPRQISMHLCRYQLKMPFIKIGDLFGKDHSTVMSSVKLIQKALEADDKEIAGSYRAIVQKLRESKDEL